MRKVYLYKGVFNYMCSRIRFCNIPSMRMLTINYNVSHEALKRSIAKALVSMSGMNILKVSVWNILVETYKYLPFYVRVLIVFIQQHQPSN